MPSLKTLRSRIASVKATQKITKAMQMVAAAKLRRAQMAAEAARPYAERMSTVLANLGAAFEGRADAPVLLAGNGKSDVHLLIVCTAERGLCGAFNSSIARLARDHAQRLVNEGKTVKILCVGRKGADALRRTLGDKFVEVIELKGIRQLGFGEAQGVARKVFELFETGQFDVATLFFSRFRSVILQIPTAQQIIPADIPAEAKVAATAGAGAVYDIEPGEAEILEELLPRNVAVQIFRALLENAASEQGARMSAMDSATRNAGEMIKKLTQTYNRSRQAMITKELIEIISGAEAV
jgi:F-type H+-transporting ATPase subunit gamma